MEKNMAATKFIGFRVCGGFRVYRGLGFRVYGL